MTTSITGSKFRAWDSFTGMPLSFGKVYIYRTGTNIPIESWKTPDKTEKNPWPVELNGAGYADIVIDETAKVVVKDKDGVEVHTTDPVSLQPDVLSTVKQGIYPYDAETDYQEGQLVIASDKAVYQAGQANKGINPVTDTVGVWLPFERFKRIESAKLLETRWFPVGTLVETQGYHSRDDDGGNLYVTVEKDEREADGGSLIASTAYGIQFQSVRQKSLYAEQFGWLDDDETDNTLVLANIEHWLRKNHGGTVTFLGVGIGRTTQPFVIPSNSTIHMAGKIRNVTTGGWGSYGTLLGQCNREDIARCKGEEETAHYLGVLSQGVAAVNVGERWHNGQNRFTNARTWVPEVGDLCVVCTTDDTANNTERPVPSFTHHRKVIAVNGSQITLDKGVAGEGEYMIIPTSRNLGYDRSKYGGIGRMETVENIQFTGNVESQYGFPMLTGGIINSRISGEFSGRSSIYGNGIRSTVINTTGWFSRNAYEVAFGSEDFEIHTELTHIPRGQNYTVACCQISERPTGGKIGRVRVSAEAWDGNDAFAVFGKNIEVVDQEISTSAKLRCVAIGSTSTPSDNFKSHRMLISSNREMSGRLIESVNSREIKINAELSGNSTNEDAVLLQSGGRVESLKIRNNSGNVRITGDYLVESVEAAGQLVTDGTLIQRGTVKPRLRSGYLEFCMYEPELYPTTDCEMTISGDVTLHNPVGTFTAGDLISLHFAQNETGGHVVRFAPDSLYRGINLPEEGGVNASRLTIGFRFNGTVWVCNESNHGWFR